jgi:hypothetical protein
MSRDLNFRSRTFNPYAKGLGEVALIWNDFHMVLSGLFGSVTKIPNLIAADTIWNSLRADRSQRVMLESLIDLNAINYNIPSKLRDEMLWVLDQATRIEDLRNDLLHSPVLLGDDKKPFAWHHLGNYRAKKLAGKDLLREARLFYDHVIILREYTEKLHEAYRRQGSEVRLPRRPSLPSRGASKK